MRPLKEEGGPGGPRGPGTIRTLRKTGEPLQGLSETGATEDLGALCRRVHQVPWPGGARLAGGCSGGRAHPILHVRLPRPTPGTAESQ